MVARHLFPAAQNEFACHALLMMVAERPRIRPSSRQSIVNVDDTALSPTEEAVFLAGASVQVCKMSTLTVWCDASTAINVINANPTR